MHIVKYHQCVMNACTHLRFCVLLPLLMLQTAFLCDIFPHIRSLVFDALDHTPAPSASLTAAEVDAQLAVILSAATKDSRSSRRTTRATRGEAKPKRPRRWQHLFEALSKSSDVIAQLEKCEWKDVARRPLQTSSVWKRIGATAQASPEASASTPVAPAAPAALTL
jgi:hypothetical protein